MSESFAIAMFGALFAVMNPFINLPVFLGLTEDLHQSEQRSAAQDPHLHRSVLHNHCNFWHAILTFFGAR